MRFINGRIFVVLICFLAVEGSFSSHSSQQGEVTVPDQKTASEAKQNEIERARTESKDNNDEEEEDIVLDFQGEEIIDRQEKDDLFESSDADGTSVDMKDEDIVFLTESSITLTDGPRSLLADGPTVTLTGGPTANLTSGSASLLTDGRSATLADGPTTTLIDGPTAILTDGPTETLTNGLTATLTDVPTTTLTDGPTVTLTNGPTATLADSPTANFLHGPTRDKNTREGTLEKSTSDSEDSESSWVRFGDEATGEGSETGDDEVEQGRSGTKDGLAGTEHKASVVDNREWQVQESGDVGRVEREAVVGRRLARDGEWLRVAEWVHYPELHER